MKKLLAIVFAFSLSACAMNMKIASNADLSKLQQIKKGQTSKDEAVKLLGNKYETEIIDGQTNIIYLAGAESQTGLLGGFAAVRDQLFLIINDKNKVEDYYLTRNGIRGH